MNTDMLTCEEALERMSQALDGPLPLEERQALEEHLESCPECRATYEALFQMEDALREIGETPAPAELSARVMEQIQEEAAPARRPAPRWNRAGWRNLAGLAACAVLCLGLWHGAGLGSRENVVDEPSAASQSAGQEDASSRGLLDEMEPAQEEDPVDAQPAPAQADAPEEDTPEKAESSLPSGQEEAACAQAEEVPAADTRSILEQESPEVPEAPAPSLNRSRSRSRSRRRRRSPRFRGALRTLCSRTSPSWIPRLRAQSRMNRRRSPVRTERQPSRWKTEPRPKRPRPLGERGPPWCCPPFPRRRRSFSPPGRSGPRRRTAPAGVL